MTTEAFLQRRARLAERMAAMGGGVAVLFTAPEVARNRDSDYPYRHDSYFHYLTAFGEPEAALVMVVEPGRARAILFCRSKNEEREIWDGFRFGPAAARRRFGFDEAYPIDELDARMPALLANRPAIFHALSADEALDARLRAWLGAARAQARAGVSAPARAHDLLHVLDEMRLIKDADEIATMKHSAAIAADAHCRAMRATRPGMYEYEIEAEILHEFHRRGAPSPAYGSIVAGGGNACVLHYRENDARLKSGDLLLIDAGCEYQGYASDITRTFPVNGRFGGAQRELYEIVLAAQRAAELATRPGKRFDEPHEAAVRVLAQGMLDCKLLRGSLAGVLESGAYRRFYMHRTGHWLGRDVHDCGDYREAGDERVAPIAPPRPARPARAAAAAKAAPARARAATKPAAPAPRPWRKLAAGMVVTIEPGIYVRAADDVPKAYHDIGIRIEDDALLTARGCELITSGVPKACDDIEALMRDA
ncbi:MAG: aminopeptidase P N-terminal domain-containing protein [Lautropia sp.]